MSICESMRAAQSASTSTTRSSHSASKSTSSTMRPSYGEHDQHFRRTFLKLRPDTKVVGSRHPGRTICWTEEAVSEAVTPRHTFRSGAAYVTPTIRTPKKVLKKSKSSPQLFRFSSNSSNNLAEILASRVTPPPTTAPPDYPRLPRTSDVTALTGTSRGGVFRSGWVTAPPPSVAREKYLVYTRSEAPRNVKVWIPDRLLVSRGQF